MSLFSRTRAAWDALFQKEGKRGFNAASVGRLYADWFTAASSADAEIRGSQRRLLDRSRDCP
jgi:hypothetical protein